jgi:2'-5' RNA ligase
MDTIRAFIAIPLPQSLLERLSMLQQRLEKHMPHRGVRWARSEGIHLTLKFLGDTPTGKLPDIKQALSVVARHTPTCTFTAEGLGCFPNLRRPRVIWVGIQEPTGTLVALRDAIEEVVAPLGYPPEGRKFTPHLTLGRIRRRTSRGDAARIGEVVTNWVGRMDNTSVETLAEVTVEHFALIRSVLKPTGAEYTTLESFPLRQLQADCHS